MAAKGAERIRRIARDQLGFAALRPGQLEGVESILSGRDTLCVMATGSGKTAVESIDPLIIVQGFDRPDIHLAVDRFYDAEHKRRAVVEAVA